jgi:hypothetical protein
VNCACCWSKEAGTNHALICIAGRDAKIKVYRVKDASLYAVSAVTFATGRLGGYIC